MVLISTYRQSTFGNMPRKRNTALIVGIALLQCCRNFFRLSSHCLQSRVKGGSVALWVAPMLFDKSSQLAVSYCLLQCGHCAILAWRTDDVTAQNEQTSKAMDWQYNSGSLYACLPFCVLAAFTKHHVYRCTIGAGCNDFFFLVGWW